MEKLKPCPFCGNDFISVVSFGNRDGYYVVCRDCCATSGWRETKEQARAAWNRRIQEAGPDIPIYDKETRIDNCTVQILENTETGRVSIGWWRNE